MWGSCTRFRLNRREQRWLSLVFFALIVSFYRRHQTPLSLPHGVSRDNICARDNTIAFRVTFPLSATCTPRCRVSAQERLEIWRHSSSTFSKQDTRQISRCCKKRVSQRSPSPKGQFAKTALNNFHILISCIFRKIQVCDRARVCTWTVVKLIEFESHAKDM